MICSRNQEQLTHTYVNSQYCVCANANKHPFVCTVVWVREILFVITFAHLVLLPYLNRCHCSCAKKNTSIHMWANKRQTHWKMNTMWEKEGETERERARAIDSMSKRNSVNVFEKEMSDDSAFIYIFRLCIVASLLCVRISPFDVCNSHLLTTTICLSLFLLWVQPEMLCKTSKSIVVAFRLYHLPLRSRYSLIVIENFMIEIRNLVFFFAEILN